MRLLVLAGLLLAATPAWAGPTFGAEFEFTSKKLMNSPGTDKPGPIERNAAKQFAKTVQQKCPECKVISETYNWGHEFKVTFPDGFYFRVSYDPGCVEIQTMPGELTQFTAEKERLNQLVFGTAKDLGLAPTWADSAGHMNFGTFSTFGDDPELFARFAADFANHPQLSMGAWGKDMLNAPSLNYLKQYQRDAFSKIMEDARNHKFTHLQDVAYRINNEVYVETTDETFEPYHYQAMSVKNLRGAEPVAHDVPTEIRSFYPQFSTEDFIRNAEIIDRRVQFLRETKPPIVYFNIRQRIFRAQNIVDSYYMYLTEMGLDWDKYKTTMNPRLQKIEPGDFVQGKVTWTPEFAKSVEEFAPYIKTSAWARQRIVQAFTAEGVADNPLVQIVLEKVIRGADADSPAVASEVSVFEEILNHPTWQKNAQRNWLMQVRSPDLPLHGTVMPRQCDAVLLPE